MQLPDRSRQRGLLVPAAQRLARSICLVLVLATTTAAITGLALADTSFLWSDVTELSIPVLGERPIQPSELRSLRLDIDRLRALLADAPLEATGGVRSSTFVVALPLPDGSDGHFRIAVAPVMAAELATRHPDIRTYVGQGIDDQTATVRFDLTPAGFHAMIRSAAGTVYIDPFQRQDVEHYMSYNRSAYRLSADLADGRAAAPSVCEGVIGNDTPIAAQVQRIVARGAPVGSGAVLRTYRLAVAATGEYTQFFGGTVGDATAAIVTTLNRIVGVYETEVAIRLELVANNDLLVYTNPATDPYTNGNVVAMIAENQANVDAVIGSANYDIGHVFGTASGGLAAFGVCRPLDKGRAASGAGNFPGDLGDLLAAHEMGHQFFANHTFNGTQGQCTAGNRNASTAYEPGSGSTLMSYAGICGTHNVEGSTDGYFHVISFDEIVAYSTVGAGDGCAVATATGNNAPVPDAGVGGFSIPLSTPFTLIGTATDPDSDPMTYSWEQFDLGPAGAPDAPVGNAPLFRVFPPVTSPERTFPQIADIVAGTSTVGEILPFYARDLTFRFVARDNRADGGGVNWDSITFSVTDQAGPFLVTAPNTAVTWTGNASETVSWDVAGTSSAPVSSASVDILLSLDGGFTYPITVLAGTPNDGSEAITVPNIATSTARIKVAAADNVFFDISDSDFEILDGGGAPPDIDVAPLSISFTVPEGSSASDVLTIANTAVPGSMALTWSLAELPTQPRPHARLDEAAIELPAATGGPDAFGYVWTDSDQPGGPMFAWQDITGVGTILNFGGNDSWVGLTLPFDFTFYGVPQTDFLRISSNGFLSYRPEGFEPVNAPIPDPADPNLFIAPFWDDLDPTSGGSAHYYHDAGAGAFIVQWTDVPRSGGGGIYTFQVSLRQDETMLFQYLDMAGELGSATIGIENADGSTGLEIAYNAPYVHDTLAIEIGVPDCAWLTESATSGAVIAGGSQPIDIVVDATGLEPGAYGCDLLVTSNDPDEATVTVPVTLTVQPEIGVPDVTTAPAPLAHHLYANVPNPFNPSTTIRYELAEPSAVSITIYDGAGRLVRTLSDQMLHPAGSHDAAWDGRDNTGRPQPSGVYFYRIEAGTFAATRQMTLLK